MNTSKYPWWHWADNEVHRIIRPYPEFDGVLKHYAKTNDLHVAVRTINLPLEDTKHLAFIFFQNPDDRPAQRSRLYGLELPKDALWFKSPFQAHNDPVHNCTCNQCPVHGDDHADPAQRHHPHIYLSDPLFSLLGHHFDGDATT